VKKLLAVFASFGLVATTTLTVIACTTNEDTLKANVNLNQVKSWFNNAQPTNDREGKTMLITIGGRYNSDTLSYLATLNQLINGDFKNNPKQLLEQERITNIDNELSNFSYSGKPIVNPNDWQGPLMNIINGINSGLEAGTPNQSSIIAEKYLKYNRNNPIDQMEFHTILVDRIEDFWNSSLGTGIINEILGPQIKTFLDFIFDEDGIAKDPEDKDEKNNKNSKNYKDFIKDKTKSYLETLQKNKDSGPWFLIVRSGKVVGIKTGFRNYYEFNPSYTSNEKDANSISENKNNLVGRTFKEFSESIIKSLRSGITWLETNFKNRDRKINRSDLFTKNVPDNNNSSWTSKTSGISNITDLDKPRGDEKEPPTESFKKYSYKFLD